MSEIIDLRSDVCSTPTKAMRSIMATAEIGIDDYAEDESINRFERRMSEYLGKEAALFVQSGTMGNLIAVMTHLKPDDVLLISKRFHIFDHEGDAMRRVARCVFAHIAEVTEKGRTRLLFEQFEEKLYQKTTAAKLLCLENPVCRLGGTLLDLDHMQQLHSFAERQNILIHLDGARLFNAACALESPPRDIVALVDSVMVDFVKAPAAAVGAVLLGTTDFIARARQNRSLLGGHWKQGGVLAASCEIALDTMIDRIVDDHVTARQLAEGLDAIAGLQVDLDQVVTNIVHLKVPTADIDLPLLKHDLEKHGALIGRFKEDRHCRLVTHKDVSPDAVTRFVGLMSAAVDRQRIQEH
jgi:threonine aldolase